METGIVEVLGMIVAEHLFAKHRILVVPIVTEGEYQGLRVTPNVYTTLEEVDYFAEVMEKIIKTKTLV